MTDLEIYIRCSILLSKSCGWHGIPYGILTNEPELLNDRLRDLREHVQVVSLDMTRQIPEHMPFFSAHFKLDALKKMGDGTLGDVVGLLDLDMVMINSLGIFADGQDHSRSALYVYDITSQQISAYGEKTLLHTLAALGHSELKSPKWYGGEFIAGRAEAFRLLSEEIDKYYARYISESGTLHHIGDESVVTASLLSASGLDTLDLRDAATTTVSRWWSSRTLHPQVPFSSAKSAALLHLPADKIFLAKEALKEFDPNLFISRYQKHIRRKIAMRKLANVLAGIGQGQWRHTPRLS